MVRITLLLIWIAALYGVLQAGPHLGDLGHGICGPWGCGPSLEALLVYHGFWLVLIGGLTTLAVQSCSAATLHVAGRTLTVVGLCGLLGLTVWELAHMTDTMRQYAVQRCLFAVATQVDVPIMPTTLAGIACWIASHRKNAAHRRKSDPSTIRGHDMARDVVP